MRTTFLMIAATCVLALGSLLTQLPNPSLAAQDKSLAQRQLPANLKSLLGDDKEGVSSFAGSVKWIRVADDVTIFQLRNTTQERYFALSRDPKKADARNQQTNLLYTALTKGLPVSASYVSSNPSYALFIDLEVP
jgi:hypothetical protein